MSKIGPDDIEEIAKQTARFLIAMGARGAEASGEPRNAAIAKMAYAVAEGEILVQEVREGECIFLVHQDVEGMIAGASRAH